MFLLTSYTEEGYPKKNTPSVAPFDISAPITIAIGRLILDPNGPVIGDYTCQYIPLWYYSPIKTF